MSSVRLKIPALILFSCISTGLHSQFPAPVSFQFSYDYIELDSWGDCNGVSLFGPAYCSRFKWSVPDTSGIDATLDHYQIYINDVAFTQVEDTFYTIDQGFIGKFYVTAVYVNPSGESDSSNVEFNNDLPISTGDMKSPGRHEFIYNKPDRKLIARNAGNIQWLKIYNIMGMEVWSATRLKTVIDVSGFEPGIYILESRTVHGLSRQKVLIR